MEDAHTIILPPGAANGDDLGVRQLFELFVESFALTWAELTVRSHRSRRERVFTVGSRDGEATAIELALDDDTDAALTVAADARLSRHALELFAATLGRELHRLRLLAESALLHGAADATTTALLIFGPTGSILFANRRADELISRQTEDELTVVAEHGSAQPLFRLLCARVGQLLDGTDDLPQRDRFDLSDGSELRFELLPLSTGEGGLGRVVLAVLRETGAPPDQRVDEFAELHRLSPREREVLWLLVQGCDTPGLADRLGISPHTVRDHLKNVFRKTRTRSRSELVSALAGASGHTTPSSA